VAQKTLEILSHINKRVRAGEAVIVDEFTGRTMAGRRCKNFRRQLTVRESEKVISCVTDIIRQRRTCGMSTRKKRAPDQHSQSYTSKQS
jgi:hypothetical protein